MSEPLKEEDLDVLDDYRITSQKSLSEIQSDMVRLVAEIRRLQEALEWCSRQSEGDEGAIPDAVEDFLKGKTAKEVSDELEDLIREAPSVAELRAYVREGTPLPPGGSPSEP